MNKRAAASMMVIALLLAVCGYAHGAAPRSIAGIKLGSQIDEYKPILDMSTSLPLKNMEYLSSVDVKLPEGYKSGYVFYGNCAHPGRIVKLKLKYLRDDKAFYQELLDLFRKKFGKATQYKGDPFGGFTAWKWSFKQNNESISLILQYNSVNDEEHTAGVSVKLSLTTAVEEEKACYDRKNPQKPDNDEAMRKEKLKSIQDFGPYIPD